MPCLEKHLTKFKIPDPTVTLEPQKLQRCTSVCQSHHPFPLRFRKARWRRRHLITRDLCAGPCCLHISGRSQLEILHCCNRHPSNRRFCALSEKWALSSHLPVFFRTIKLQFLSCSTHSQTVIVQVFPVLNPGKWGHLLKMRPLLLHCSLQFL